MEHLSPIELVRQRNLAESERTQTLKQRFEDERDRSCVELLNETTREFVSFVAEHGYPLANLVAIEGEEYITYPLYDTLMSDGELYYENLPISLIFNSDGEASFALETTSDGLTIGEHFGSNHTEPIPFQLPGSLDEYRASLENKRLHLYGIGLRYDYRDLLAWIAFMKQYEDEVLNGPLSKRTNNVFAAKNMRVHMIEAMDRAITEPLEG